MLKKLPLHGRRMRQVLSVVVALLLVCSVSYLGVRYFQRSKAATPGSIYVTPASGSLAPGSTLSVTVREDSGATSVNSVQFFLNYSANQLEFLSLTEGGDFDFIGPSSTSQAGVVRVQRGMQSGGATGDHPIVTLNFRVLATSGSTSLSIDQPPNSFQTATSDSKVITQSVAGGTYSIAGSTTTTATKDAVLSFSPASGNFQPGATIAVDVRLKSPTQKVFSVQPIILYPAGQLQYVSTTSSAAFPSVIRTSNNNGTLDIIRGTTPGEPGFSGDGAIATVKFKVVGTTGTAGLSFKTGSGAFDGSGKDLVGSTGTAAFTLGTPPVNGGTTTPPPSNPATTAPPAAGSGTNAPPKSSSVVKGSVTFKAASGSSVSLAGNATEVAGSVELAPVANPEIVAQNPDVSIKKVEYYLKGKRVSSRDTAPFTYSFDTKKMKNGNYDITITTYYSNGLVDNTNSRLVVKNPITLQYVLVSYGGSILASVIGLIIITFLVWRFIWPRVLTPAAAGAPSATYDSYNGYDGAGAPSPAQTVNQAPEPAIVAPTAAQNQPEVPLIAPEQIAATQATRQIAMQSPQTYTHAGQMPAAPQQGQPPAGQQPPYPGPPPSS
jgi:hypothetical protein